MLMLGEQGDRRRSYRVRAELGLHLPEMACQRVGLGRLAGPPRIVFAFDVEQLPAGGFSDRAGAGRRGRYTSDETVTGWEEISKNDALARVGRCGGWSRSAELLDAGPALDGKRGIEIYRYEGIKAYRELHVRRPWRVGP